MALKIIDHGTPEYQQMVKLRDDHSSQTLGLGFTPEELEEEKDNMLIAAFEEERYAWLLYAGGRTSGYCPFAPDGCIK